MSSNEAPLVPPTLTHFATAKVLVGKPHEIGQTREGMRRIIPITGGTLEGPAGSGEILPVGADFQVVRSATSTELLAKYAIRMSDGEHITVDNFGVRTAAPEDIAALVAGQPVPPERVYFRCVPQLSGTGSWSWVDDRLFIASGRRFPTHVEVDIFEVQ